MNTLTVVATWAILIWAMARVTRLLVFDIFPPAVAFRMWYKSHIPENWAELVDCNYCAALWVGLALGNLAYWAGLIDAPDSLSVFGQIVWLFFAWLGASYVAAIIVTHDD